MGQARTDHASHCHRFELERLWVAIESMDVDLVAKLSWQVEEAEEDVAL